MTLLVLATAIVFLATGVCALVEAALYAVRQPYVRQLAVVMEELIGEDLSNVETVSIGNV